MDDIEDALRQFAYDDDYGWEVTTNSMVTRVQARTMATFLSSGEAFGEAYSLAKTLLDLGYQECELTQLGAIAVRDDEDPDALRWRGKIELIMRARLDERL
jgi:hypothetical protein